MCLIFHPNRARSHGYPPPLIDHKDRKSARPYSTITNLITCTASNVRLTASFVWLAFCDLKSLIIIPITVPLLKMMKHYLKVAENVIVWQCCRWIFEFLRFVCNSSNSESQWERSNGRMMNIKTRSGLCIAMVGRHTWKHESFFEVCVPPCLKVLSYWKV